MAIKGRASVLTSEDWERVFSMILNNRHAEKNAAIMNMSRHLGLKAQELAALTINDVTLLGGNDGESRKSFTLRKEVFIAPRETPKDRSQSKYVKKSITFTVSEFEDAIEKVVSLVKAGREINPNDFYPTKNQKSTISRQLPLVKEPLVNALNKYIKIRLINQPFLRSTDPLFITQKGGSYSPNTLQEHIALILRDWAGIVNATSNSGRRGLITHALQTYDVNVAQKVAGVRSPSSVAVTYNDRITPNLNDSKK
jgi:integrase